MIKEPITLTFNNSYNINDWIKGLIARCIVDNPNHSVEEIAELLGISGRTLHRYMNEFKIDLHTSRVTGYQFLKQNKHSNISTL